MGRSSNRFLDYKITQLPNLHELEPLLPVHDETIDRRRRRSRLIEPPRRLALRDVEKLVVPYEVDHAKRRDAGLPGPEEIPRPAQPQIAFGDLEAVGRVCHCFEPLARFLRQRRLVEQKAVRLVRIAADSS